MTLLTEGLNVATRLDHYWHARADASFDPYDGLLARWPRGIHKTRATRLAAVQLHRRSPANLRRVFGIVPSRNSYAVANLASAAAVRPRASIDPGSDARMLERIEWLRNARTNGGWAYPFDVQTKTYFYSSTTPNVICTSMAAAAFLDVGEYVGDDSCLKDASRTVRFLLQSLRRTDGARTYFAYLPDRGELIHNANALASAVAVRAGVLTNDDEMVRAGLNAVESTMAAIRADGSIPYGEGDGLAWIDGHHTGFVVEGLHTIRNYTGVDVGQSFNSLVSFYAQALFSTDGTPIQRLGHRHPIDTIACAQGTQTFAKLGGRHLPLASRIAQVALDRMLSPAGHFVFQRWRLHTKSTSYLRWCDGPMILALAHLARAQVEEPGT